MKTLINREKESPRNRETYLYNIPGYYIYRPIIAGTLTSIYLNGCPGRARNRIIYNYKFDDFTDYE